MKKLILLILLLCPVIIRASEWHAWDENSSLPTSEVYALAFDADGRMLIGTGEGLFAIREGNAVYNIPLCTVNSRQPTVNRIEIENNCIFIRTLDGSYVLEGDSARLFDSHQIREYVYKNVPASLQNVMVKDMAVLPHGWKAYATNSDGVFLYRRSTGCLTNMRSSLADVLSLPSNHISSVAYDNRSGRLFAAVYHSGIYYTEPQLSAVETMLTGVEENISSFAIDGRGRLWTAYDGAGICIGGDTMLTALPSLTITNLLPLPDGDVLAASYGGGVFRIDSLLRATSIPALDETSNAARSRGLGIDSLGHIWVSSFSEGVMCYDISSVSARTFDSSNSALKTNYITDLCVSPQDDTVFVASHYGVYAFDILSFGSVELPTPFFGDGRIVVDQLAFSADGTLYFATPAGITDRYGRNIALEGTHLKALKNSPDGSLWCSSDSAVYRVDTRYRPSKVDVFDGFEGMRFCKYALCHTDDGTVLAGAFGAVAVIGSDSDAVHKVQGTSVSRFLIWTLYIFLGLILICGLYVLIRHKRYYRTDGEIHAVHAFSNQPEDVICDETAPEDNSEADCIWIGSIDNIIDANIANAEFSVEDLGRLAGMSRSNLYKRIKAITGLSPLEYLRDRRVKRGRQLLAQATGKHVKPTLAEIAYQVGMSPRQFSKYIRQE